MSYDTELESPLCCKLRGGVLQIEVGLSRLNGNERHPTIPEMKIVSPRVWGEDIIRELEREEEDGSSLLTNLFDNAITAAFDYGSIAVTRRTSVATKRADARPDRGGEDK
jgi:hypothetical protein